MSQVYVTLSKEMLQALLANLIDLKFPASDFLVENEVDGINEITRIINLVSGDVFEQAVQKQDNEESKSECKIYEFPPKPLSNLTSDDSPVNLPEGSINGIDEGARQIGDLYKKEINEKGKEKDIEDAEGKKDKS